MFQAFRFSLKQGWCFSTSQCTRKALSVCNSLFPKWTSFTPSLLWFSGMLINTHLLLLITFVKLNPPVLHIFEFFLSDLSRILLYLQLMKQDIYVEILRYCCSSVTSVTAAVATTRRRNCSKEMNTFRDLLFQNLNYSHSTIRTLMISAFLVLLLGRTWLR